MAMKSFPLVSATGMLGSGFRVDSLDKAIALDARMIGCDAGSTDSRPRSACHRHLHVLRSRGQTRYRDHDEPCD
jgi:hypothetical protein